MITNHRAFGMQELRYDPSSGLCFCVTLGSSWLHSGPQFPPVRRAQCAPPGLHGGPGHPCNREENHDGLCCPLSYPTPAPPLASILHGLSWHGIRHMWEGTRQVSLLSPSQSRLHPAGQFGRGRLSPQLGWKACERIWRLWAGKLGKGWEMRKGFTDCIREYMKEMRPGM